MRNLELRDGDFSSSGSVLGQADSLDITADRILTSGISRSVDPFVTDFTGLLVAAPQDVGLPAFTSSRRRSPEQCTQ